MKKILFLFPMTFMFLFAFRTIAKAETYQANNLEVGQYLEAGDIIEFGTGVYNGKNYSKISGNCPELFYFNLENGQTTILPNDCFVVGLGVGRNSIGNNSWMQMGIGLRPIIMRFADENNNIIPPNNGEFSNSCFIDLREGETIQLRAVWRGNMTPASFVWKADFWSRDPDELVVDLNCSSDSYAINYNGGFETGDVIVCIAFDANGKFLGDIGGEIRKIPRENPTVENEETSLIVEEEYQTPSVEPQTPQNPSTLPSETVQITLDDKGTFSNIKVLNQYPHDSVNQKLIADLYAANLRKKASILFQKNLMAPWGVNNAWKKTSHTVRWKDLPVKKGDRIVIVWYTPTFFGFTPTLKIIPAAVVEDGVITFTAPQLGDMSVMSIVKLI